MKPLFTWGFCPNECDRPRPQVKVTTEYPPLGKVKWMDRTFHVFELTREAVRPTTGSGLFWADMSKKFELSGLEAQLRYFPAYAQKHTGRCPVDHVGQFLPGYCMEDMGVLGSLSDNKLVWFKEVTT
jgi:hypothetical protein